MKIYQAILLLFQSVLICSLVDARRIKGTSKRELNTETNGNGKGKGEIEYYLQASMVAYHQNASDIYWFSSLAYEFTASGEEKSARDIEIRIN